MIPAAVGAGVARELELKRVTMALGLNGDIISLVSTEVADKVYSSLWDVQNEVRSQIISVRTKHEAKVDR